MFTRRASCLFVVAILLHGRSAAWAQQTGAIRGILLDADFDVPLPGVTVSVDPSGRSVTSGPQGSYLLDQLPPGLYTVRFRKTPGYLPAVRREIRVRAGQLVELDVALEGDYTVLEDFTVEDALSFGAGTEAELLSVRFESSAVLDAISSELLSRAGASDAADAVNLIAGASVQDGKFAVVRGLPDRYISSQVNGLRVPSADEDKRAVELDQFPAAVIETIQISKTFTPDQQGDASGGAVNVVLKSIPAEPVFQIKGQFGANSQVTGVNDFLTYDGGGVGGFGFEGDSRDPQLDNIGDNWTGAVGTRTDQAPIDTKWSLATGGSTELDEGSVFGGFFSLFYERDSELIENARDDSLWVDTPGEGLVPQITGESVGDGNFTTNLFDITRSSQLVQWGGLASVGYEADKHEIGLSFLYTRTAEDRAILATDTRGKEFFFPGYDPNDPTGPGNQPDDTDTAPYLRTETLEYTERQVGTLQLTGGHELPFDGLRLSDAFEFTAPRVDWAIASSFAVLDQPDKRDFGARWRARSFNPGLPEFGIDPFFTPPEWFVLTPSQNINLGNLQRTYKKIDEDSLQLSADLTLPFDQWTGDEGALSFGVYRDKVDRKFDQDTFSNFGDQSTYQGDFDDPWSGVFSSEDHPVFASEVDVDYVGEQEIQALYGMIDLPLSPTLTLVGGARFESTDISVVNTAEDDAIWFPPGNPSPVDLLPGEADVQFDSNDILPALGLTYRPKEWLTLRAAYSETIARQTFKELTPVIQQEFLGGPLFVGNPELTTSNLENFDLRADVTPYEGGLFSVSWFHKNIENPIENVQRLVGFDFTTPVNYPEGELTGYEFEIRQDLSLIWNGFRGLKLGGNATFIDSEVTLSAEESVGFSEPNIDAPLFQRDATNAPDFLYNLYLTYDLPDTGTQLSLFYTVKGDTLIAGAGESEGNFVPNVYEQEFGTLNFNLSQRVGDHWIFQFQAKNLTNPAINTIYRSDFIESDTIQTSFTRGIEYSLGFSFIP